MYGSSAIHAKWEGVSLDTVKATWANALADYTPHQIGYALDSLKANNFPPTLPEFLGYCNQGRQVIPSPVLRIERKKYDPNDPEIVAARERCMATMRSMKLGRPKPSRAWAYKALRRHEEREHLLTPDELRVALDCIALDRGADDPYQAQAAE